MHPMVSRVQTWIAWVLVVGCSHDDGQSSLATSGSSTGGGTTIAATSSDGTAAAASSSEGPPMHATEGSTAVGSSDSGGESSTGEPPIQLCGIEDLKPGAPNPIVSGTAPMQIPPDIAEILANNCGCHYADMLAVIPSPDYSSLLPLKIETWDEWHGVYGPMNKSTLTEVLARVQGAPIQFTMPHRFCNVGDGEQMLPEERQILIDWIVADAPDGATWMPR